MKSKWSLLLACEKQLSFSNLQFRCKMNFSWLLMFGCLVLSTANTFAQVGISATTITPHSSSILELRSTYSGFLLPRMTTTERDAIATPANALMIFNTTTNQLNCYYSGAWQSITTGNLSGDVTSVGNTTTIGAGKVTNAMLAGSIDLTTKVINTLPVSRGGTGQSSALVPGGILYGSTTTTTGTTAAGTTGQVLQSAGVGTPIWSTASYPASAGNAGNYLRSNGTNFVSTPITHNQSTNEVARSVTGTAVRMLGYGTTITPARSGTILIMVSGDITHPTAAHGGQVQIAFGTGTIPVNGAAQTGTTTGGDVKFLNGSGNQAAAGKAPFSLQSIVSGLTVGTTYWVDLQAASTNISALTFGDVTISIIEL
jgi:hypothetical protein